VIIDRFAPDAEFQIVVHRLVHADPGTVYDAMLHADLGDDPVVRAMVGAREIPNRVAARLRDQPYETDREPWRFGEMASTPPWVRLGEVPGVELCGGAIGRFWQRDYGWVDIANPAAFGAFDEPGYAKTLISLSVRPYSDESALISYDSRTLVTDDAARVRFRRYWWILRPFVHVVMARTLVTIAHDAERRGVPVQPGVTT
jgi:hypothetical protein